MESSGYCVRVCSHTSGIRSDLVALLRLVVAVGVGEVDVAACILHHLLDVVASFANDVGVLGVRDVHFQSHAIALHQ